MLLRAKHGNSIKALGLSTAAALGFLLIGCAGPNDEDKVQQGDGKAAVAEPNGADTKNRPMASNNAQDAPAQEGQDPTPSATTPPRDDFDSGRVVGETPTGSFITRVGPEEDPNYPSEEDLERRREEASDMIYALIRVRMEEAIIKRKTLLESGRASSDVEVRRLENVIMNARQYLEEDGEIVEPVDPPIVQTRSSGKKAPR